MSCDLKELTLLEILIFFNQTNSVRNCCEAGLSGFQWVFLCLGFRKKYSNVANIIFLIIIIIHN